jgi:L-fuconolactonase
MAGSAGLMERLLSVDSHHHFWDPARATYAWMNDELAPIRRRFGPEDLRPLIAAAGIGHTILVQTRSSLDETREFLALAARTDFIAGVVGWVDLTASGVADRIAELRAGSGGERLVAIRHQVHDEPDEGWLWRPSVRRGLRAVGDAGLAYDLLVRARELPAALLVARELADVRFVVNHLAKPPIRAGAIEEWAARLQPLAALPNVFAKLSGLVTEADWRAWRVEELVPYVSRALDWFGAERLLFGSDWPVCLLAAPYTGVIDAYSRALGGISAAERERIFGFNAVAAYRVAVPAGTEGRR